MRPEQYLQEIAAERRPRPARSWRAAVYAVHPRTARRSLAAYCQHRHRGEPGATSCARALGARIRRPIEYPA